MCCIFMSFLSHIFFSRGFATLFFVLAFLSCLLCFFVIYSSIVITHKWKLLPNVRIEVYRNFSQDLALCWKDFHNDNQYRRQNFLFFMNQYHRRFQKIRGLYDSMVLGLGLDLAKQFNIITMIGVDIFKTNFLFWM